VPAEGPDEATVAEPDESGDVSSDGADCFWPRFHGPRGDNVSDDTGLLTEWPEGGPPLAWKVQGIGFGYSGVTIADGTLYTSGNIDGASTITAMSLDGEFRWQVNNGRAFDDDGSYPGTRSTPTIDGEFIYDQSPLGQVGCFRAKDGERVWTRNVLDDFDGEQTRWAVAESLLIDGDRVIASPGGRKTAVVALDKRTGETVWQSESAEGDAAGYCSPTLAEHGGLRMIFVMTGAAVIGVDADDGSLLFRFPHETRYGVNVQKPIFRDGLLFVSSGYGAGSVMIELNVSGKDVQVEEVWRNRRLDNHHGGVLLLGDYLYGTAAGGKWMCLDWNTGETELETRGLGKGSLTAADGLIYLLVERGRLGLIEPSPEEYIEISRFELAEGGEGRSWAHPVVCGGRLYVRHGEFLYVYDVREK